MTTGPDGSATYFDLGNVGASQAALKLMKENGINPYTLLSRHGTGDWGDMADKARKANLYAATNDLRVLGAYRVGRSDWVWIITEADRSTTIFILPCEY
jgi:hypothetical protein